MNQSLTPPERDRQAAIAAQSRPAETEPAGTSRPPAVWLWTLVGIIVLIAFAAGALAGFLGGRIYERAHGDDGVIWQDTYWLLGAALVDRSDGVHLEQLYPAGPADVAGIEEGDRLVSIDSSSTGTAADARRVLMGYSVGDSVLVTVERNHIFSQYRVVLGLAVPPTASPVVIPTVVPPLPIGTYEEARLGVYYRMLEPDDPFAVPDGALIVTLLGADTPAERAGLRVGDIITAVGNEQLSQSNTLGQALSHFSAGQTVALSVNRAGEALTFYVTLGGG